MALFYKAVEFQTDVMIKNILGQGIDIHLLGLRQLSRETGHPDAVAVFDDQSHRDINHFALSTSQVAIENFIRDKERIQIFIIQN